MGAAHLARWFFTHKYNTMTDDLYPGDEVFDKIEALCDKGEDDLERGKPRAALKRFFKAFNLLPEPVTQYPAGTWLLLHIGDIYFHWERYEQALEQLIKALDFPDGNENPFIQLRIGQCHYHLGDVAAARAALQLAYDLDGTTIFEDEDPLYWAFLNGEEG